MSRTIKVPSTKRATKKLHKRGFRRAHKAEVGALSVKRLPPLPVPAWAKPKPECKR